MNQLHWTTHVACAVCATAGLGLLLTSEATGDSVLGHLSLVAFLVSAVLVCTIICDRFARRLEAASEQLAADNLADLKIALREESKYVTNCCNDETRRICDETAQAILRTIRDEGEASLTPIK